MSSTNRLTAASAKEQLVLFLERYYRVSVVSRPSIFGVDSSAEIYIRYSRDLGNANFFFGVGVEELAARSGDRFFLLFVCGAVDNVIIIPSRTFALLVEGTQPSSGQWKLNIERKGDAWHLRVPRKGVFDVTQFNNLFDFAPSAVAPRPFPTKVADTRPVPDKVESRTPSLDLRDRLRPYAVESEDPTRLESTILEFCNEIGLAARAIGGPGDTDVLIEWPTRIVVDAKTSKAAIISHVNFTRLKQHKRLHNADSILVVGPDFQPAVVRDAEIEQAGLATVDILVKLLDMHRQLPISPDQYVTLFSMTGSLTTQDTERLGDELAQTKEWFIKATLLLRALDSAARNVYEIKGRLDVLTTPPVELFADVGQIATQLVTLSQEPFTIVRHHSDESFSLRLAQKQARERLLAIGRLCYAV